jgi:hypothetical protein
MIIGNQRQPSRREHRSASLGSLGEYRLRIPDMPPGTFAQQDAGANRTVAKQFGNKGCYPGPVTFAAKSLLCARFLYLRS